MQYGCVEVWLPLWLVTFGLLLFNTRRQYTLLGKLAKERPLDDALHSAFTSEQWIESNAHTFHRLDQLLWCGFLAVVASEYIVQGTFPIDLGQYLAEFGCLSAYKQMVCIATRLSPARQSNQVRYFCGVPVSSHIDYGISGHTGMAVLLWFHIPSSYLALVLAIL